MTRVRLQVSLTPEETKVISRAAALSGTSAANFAKTSSLAAAGQALRGREVIQLTQEGSRIFVEALISPPEPNEHLRALLSLSEREG